MTENNDNRNTITYDDDWKSVSYSEYPKASEEIDSDEEDVNSLSAENSDEKKNSPKQLVITIQLVCCILVALAAFLLNLFDNSIPSFFAILSSVASLTIVFSFSRIILVNFSLSLKNSCFIKNLIQKYSIFFNIILLNNRLYIIDFFCIIL